MRSRAFEAMMDQHLAYLLRPGGEIDRKARKEISKLLSAEVTLEGSLIRLRLCLRDWLTLVVKAQEVGWRPNGSFCFGSDEAAVVPVDNARQLAETLAKVDL